MIITLIRHAESKKNLLEVIGGLGAELTPKGRLSARRTQSKIAHHLLSRDWGVFYAPTIQTKKTANIIFSNMSQARFFQESSLLKPISLGRVSSMSTASARIKFPESMQSLADWNNGKIDISQVNIDGMQDIGEFYFSGLALVLLAQKLGAKHLFIVGTRSSLVLLKNIFYKKTPEAKGGYINSHFDYSTPQTYKLNESSLRWIRNQLNTRSKGSGILKFSKLLAIP